jgi:hypothetical protein
VHFYRGYVGAIIDYSDGESCLSKLMLLFRPPDFRNTSYLEIYSVCDREVDSDFSFLKYELLRDSSFETIESFVPANSTTVKSVEKHRWRITTDGTFNSVD